VTNSPVDFEVDNECAFLWNRRHVAREHDAELVGENLLRGGVNTPQRVAVAIEARPTSALCSPPRSRMALQNFMSSGWDVFRGKVVVELGVERHHLAAVASNTCGRELTPPTPAVLPLPQATTT